MRTAVAEARVTGLSTFDKEKFKLPNNVVIRMEDVDISRAKQMLSYPWFQRKEWQREIEHMVKSGAKLEIESLSNRGISFITEEHLPKKLKDRDWLAYTLLPCNINKLQEPPLDCSSSVSL